MDELFTFCNQFQCRWPWAWTFFERVGGGGTGTPFFERVGGGVRGPAKRDKHDHYQHYGYDDDDDKNGKTDDSYWYGNFNNHRTY